jgi:hypothetical protein
LGFKSQQNKKLTTTEGEKLRKEICKMKEMDEVEQNVWREEERKSQKLESRGKGIIPEGWTRRPPATYNKELEMRAKRLQMEEHWDKLTRCRDYLEKHEGWLCTNWLARSSHEGDRRMKWEQGEKQPRRSAPCKEIDEMQIMRDKNTTEMQKEELKDEYSQRAGQVEMAGRSDEMK